jgi:hypothetical protein
VTYQAELQTENDTSLVDIQDPRVYAAKKKNYDEDCPNLFQAMNGEFADQYLEAMKKEIKTLIAQKTWKTVPRSETTRVIKSTWFFKLKRLPGGTEKIDCYVDSDFARLFSVEDKQQPMSDKSRTCYVIMYYGVPIIWLSKIQTQIALSTMEAEYISLSQSMRYLIPIREILK